MANVQQLDRPRTNRDTALLSNACSINLALTYYLGGVFMMGERFYGNEREVRTP